MKRTFGEVTPIFRKGLWEAIVVVDGAKISVGYFASKEAACMAGVKWKTNKGFS